jgi:spore germination cell wall hydrolase CwlJ-like protein
MKKNIIALAVVAVLLTPSICFSSEKAIQTIAYEASGEDLIGQIAVACVIRNRAEKKHISFDEVVTAPYQFSCWNKDVKLRKRTDRELENAHLAWKLSEHFSFPATHYCTLNCNPYWAKSLTEITRIGNHIFYME